MALAERKMRIMSDKKIGVLGGSGEIGKRCVNILTEKGYTVMASYRTRKPMENNENVYVQLDICNENELCMFLANCDVVINCAGASFINGEKIARTAAKMKIPLVDPSGESFLEERIKDIQKDNVFVLSSGCFPGMTGVLLNFLCSQFDDVKSLSGMSISTEIPSQSAIEDFILTNIAGFGQPLKYYNNGEYVRDEQIFYEIVRNSEFKLQNYYTVELERVVKKYRPEKANWYNVLFAEEIMKKMQEAVVQFSARGYSDEFRRIVAEIKKIFADNVKNNEAFNFLKVEANGTKNGSVTGRKIEILNDSSSQISALIASHASIELLNKKIVPGIYYATDIIEGDIVLGDLPKLNIDLNISEYVMQEESFDDEFEEGTI